MGAAVFVTSPGTFAGFEECGISSCVVHDPTGIVDEVGRLIAEGASLIVVTDDLVGMRVGDLRDLCEGKDDVSLLVVPSAPGGEMIFLEDLRRRFAAALGVDIWKVSGKKAGVGL